MSDAPPNLVLICADDLGAVDLGHMGSTFYETPNLDRLASEGMSFTAGYAGSCMCSPSRAALMSGQSPPRVGVTNWIGSMSTAGPVDAVGYAKGLPDLRTLPAALREGGYTTWHVGKWHLGKGASSPRNRGFDQVFGSVNAGGPTRYWSPYRTPGLPNGPKGEYLTDRVTDEAIRLVRERPTDRPFFLNLWHFAVHTPIQAPAELVRKYLEKRRDLGMGPSLSGLEDLDVTGSTGFGRYRELVLLRRLRQSDPEFAAMIENLDMNIGRFMATLAEEGLDRDTAVVFTSDNGGVSSGYHFVPPGCNAPLAEGKGWTYEGGIRVPFFVRWPGTIKPSGISDEPVIGMDVMPTLLELAGLPLEPEAHCDGRSLAPLLLAKAGEGSEGRDLFWHYPHYQNHGGRPACSIRSGRWKLLRFFEDPAPMLFDLVDDPSEEDDVSGEHPDLVAQMGERLDEWLEGVGAEIPRSNPRWRTHGRLRTRSKRWVAEAASSLLRRRHERRLEHRVR